jgi:MFS family permease
MSDTRPAARPDLKRDANFQWLMRGGVVSMLGDQLTMVALPWLVLKLTGDPLALGLAVALMAIPRAVFILIGGALVDRHSPKRVLLLSKYASAVLLALLAALLLANRPGAEYPLGDAATISLALSPHGMLMAVYALALALGLAQAFGIPSATSILPRAVAPQNLQAANGMLMGMRQLTMLAGPLLAAALLAIAGDGSGAVTDLRGLAWAFALDCLSFVVSAWTLSKVVVPELPSKPHAQPVLRSVGAGLRMVWDDAAMRMCFLYWGAVTLFIGGAMQVALPILASERLGGASALGLLMGAHGAGTLLGMALASQGAGLQRALGFGTMILAVDAVAGLLVMPLGAIHAAWQGMALLLTLGLLTGFVQVAVFTWLQQRVPPHMMGRAMSIFMFIFMGMAPLSAALAGWVLTRIALEQLFAGGGVILVLLSLSAYLFTPMRAIRAGQAQ